MNDTYVDNDGYTEYTAYGKECISLFFFLTENIISTSDSHRINPNSNQNQQTDTVLKAIKMPPEEYLNGKGKEYRNTPYLKVCGREGKPCVKCGAVLEKLIIGGRSSVFCPNCQKQNR